MKYVTKLQEIIFILIKFQMNQFPERINVVLGIFPSLNEKHNSIIVLHLTFVMLATNIILVISNPMTAAYPPMNNLPCECLQYFSYSFSVILNRYPYS